MKNFALTVMVLLTFATTVWAQNDPDSVAMRAEERTLQALPGTYKIEGYLNTDHQPRAKPDYTGTMVISKNGKQFNVTYQWKGGGAKGTGILGGTRFLEPGDWTEGNVLFQFSVGTLNKDSQLGVTQYQLGTPKSGQSFEFSGAWRSGGQWGYEKAVKNP